MSMPRIFSGRCPLVEKVERGFMGSPLRRETRTGLPSEQVSCLRAAIPETKATRGRRGVRRSCRIEVPSEPIAQWALGATIGAGAGIGAGATRGAAGAGAETATGRDAAYSQAGTHLVVHSSVSQARFSRRRTV